MTNGQSNSSLLFPLLIILRHFFMILTEFLKIFIKMFKYLIMNIGNLKK